VSWSRLEAEAPELGALARERLARGFGLLGTVRADGSPRVSPVETLLLDGELVVGIMRRSGKAQDLRRDPRIALQSPVSDPNGGEPELKLYWRAEPSEARAGWWREHPATADVYRLELEEALHDEWEIASSTMRVRRWTAAGGESVTERAYP
jgi:hypothetical protein